MRWPPDCLQGELFALVFCSHRSSSDIYHPLTLLSAGVAEVR